jgi:hypothetical protein
MNRFPQLVNKCQSGLAIPECSRGPFRLGAFKVRQDVGGGWRAEEVESFPFFC